MMNRERTLFLTLAALAFGLVSQVQAQVTVMTTADTYLTNDPNADATVAHGSELTMEVRTQLGANTQRLRIAYFQFDLSMVSGDLGGATITLNATDSKRSRTIEVHGVVDGALGGQGEFWDENTISYSTAAGFAPAPVGSYATTSDLSSVLSTINMVNNQVGTYTSFPTAGMDTFLAADTNNLVTFAILYPGPDGNAQYIFETREAGNELQASLYLPNAAAVPEPGTMALLTGALCLMAVYLRRRRR